MKVIAYARVEASVILKSISQSLLACSDTLTSAKVVLRTPIETLNGDWQNSDAMTCLYSR
jgi:hypothetical protein